MDLNGHQTQMSQRTWSLSIKTTALSEETNISNWAVNIGWKKAPWNLTSQRQFMKQQQLRLWDGYTNDTTVRDFTENFLKLSVFLRCKTPSTPLDRFSVACVPSSPETATIRRSRQRLWAPHRFLGGWGLRAASRPASGPWAPCSRGLPFCAGSPRRWFPPSPAQLHCQGPVSQVPRTKMLLFRKSFVRSPTPQITPPALERADGTTDPASEGPIQHCISCPF